MVKILQSVICAALLMFNYKRTSHKNGLPGNQKFMKSEQKFN